MSVPKRINIGVDEKVDKALTKIQETLCINRGSAVRMSIMQTFHSLEK